MAYDFSSLKSKYEEVLSVVAEDLKGIQTGRAKPSLVEDVMIEAYGGKMPLKELASITAPDAHMILIQPWDKGVVEAIEKGLQSGQTQFNPSVDGQSIRIKIAQLTGEKREELVKLVSQRVESGRRMFREERTSEKRQVEDQEGSAGISEDDIKADLKNLEELTKEYLDKLEEMGSKKEEELRTI